MSRSPLESLKVLWRSITGGWSPEVSDATRVSSARLSQTRLKALERPDDLQPHPPTQVSTSSATDLPPLPDITDIIGGHNPNSKPSLAKVSHYRLAAYVASLPEEEREKSREELERFSKK